jgi:hypothetical protein
MSVIIKKKKKRFSLPCILLARFEKAQQVFDIMFEHVTDNTMKTRWKFDRKLFLQIILIWLLLTTASIWCTGTWTSARKHFWIIRKHLKSTVKNLPANHPDFFRSDQTFFDGKIRALLPSHSFPIESRVGIENSLSRNSGLPYSKWKELSFRYQLAKINSGFQKKIK